MFRSSLLGIALTVLICALAPAGAVAKVPFVYQTFDLDRPGEHITLRLDADGNPHLVYQHTVLPQLFYSTRSSDGFWDTDTLFIGGLFDVPSGLSMALDAQGNPHVTYVHGGPPNPDLVHAVRIDGVWIEEVVRTGDLGGDAAVEVSRNGDIHIAYNNGLYHIAYALKTGGSWSFYTIDDAVYGEQITMALDPRGLPRVAYRDITASPYPLWFAWRTEVAVFWYPELVDGVNQVYNPSLAIDRQGIPHISYGASGNDLRYATKLGAWAGEIVDAGDFGQFSSIKVDENAGIHIAYSGDPDGDLKYAIKENLLWATQVVDAVGYVGDHASLDLDPQGNPHVGYNAFNGGVRYASSAIRLTSPAGGETWTANQLATVTWEGAGEISILLRGDGREYELASGVSGGFAQVGVPDWRTQNARVRIVRDAYYSSSESRGVFVIDPERVSPWWQAKVDQTGNVGAFASLALSAAGNAHVSYHDAGNGDLKYAVKAGPGWATEIVESSGDVGSHSSLAMDPQGEPHISFYDGTSNHLRYARKIGMNWNLETADAAGNVGQMSSIGVDAAGVPHISYYDLTNVDLKYAVRTGGGWATQTVDATGFVGSYSALALDAEGIPHISYHDQTNTSLKYAVLLGGVWTTETADSTGDSGYYTSLAVGGDGTPHIASYDISNGDLRYAVKAGGVWTTEAVDTAGDVGLYTSIALGSDGTVMITYYDNTNGDLKSAVKRGGAWTITTLASAGNVGQHTSLALDPDGNPHVCHFNFTNTDLEYVSGAVSVSNPAAGEVWPVGATRAVTWSGAGAVDIALSVDGGSTYIPLASEVSGGRFDLRVPHTPSKFGVIRIERREEANDFGTFVYRHSVAETDRFTIETTVELLALLAAAPPGEPGLLVSWNTDPGPEDLAGYRLEKEPSGKAAFTLVSRTTGTSHHDVEGRPGDRYRLFAINGLNEEFYLGETRPEPAATPGGLTVYPLPLRSGDLNIEFATITLGTQVLDAEVSIHDIRGRVVRRLPVGGNDGSSRRITWDGRDDHGMPVASGIYFVRVASGPVSRAHRLVVAR